MPDEPEPERHIAWVRRFYDALKPFSRGTYVNFTSDESGDAVRQGAYSDQQWTRLVELKRAWDPTNLFHLNANIPPD